MSIKDRKLKARQGLKTERVACEEKYEAEIEQANQIADPVERILKLEKLRQMVSSDHEPEIDKISATAGKVYDMSKMESIAVFGLGLATVSAGSIFYLKKHQDHKLSFRQQLIEEAKDHFNNMSGKGTRLAKMINALVADHVQEISQSPMRADILNEPNLVRVFEAAAAERGLGASTRQRQRGDYKPPAI